MMAFTDSLSEPQPEDARSGELSTKKKRGSYTILNCPLNVQKFISSLAPYYFNDSMIQSATSSTCIIQNGTHCI